MLFLNTTLDNLQSILLLVLASQIQNERYNYL